MSTEGKVITCKAAVAWAPNTPLSIETVEVAVPKEHEVRIKILYTAICHTDLFSLEGNDPTMKFPMIVGHEAAGIVESVGPDVTNVAPGDHVIPTPLAQCNKCEICKNPNANICRKNLWGTPFLQVMDDGLSRFTCKGKQIYNFIGLSTFSQYTVVRDITVCKINPKAPFDKACLVGCGVTTGYGAPFNACVVKSGMSVGVWGLGAIGMGIVMGCAHQGAKDVIAIDINPTRLEKAKVFGATEIINPNEVPGGKSLPEYFGERFNGGLDISFEASGNTTAMAQAIESTKWSVGQTCILGVSEKDIVINASKLLMGRTIKGSIVGGFKPHDAMPMLVDKYLEGKLLLDEFISWRYPLEEINKGVEHLIKGEGIRTVIAMTNDK